MRKRIQIFAAVIAALLAVPASAQIVPFGSGAGGGGGATTIISGTTPITGGGTTQLCFNDAATLSCGDAGFTYVKGTDKATLLGGLTIGSVTTAGRATSIFLDTITGASATSNFLNITGTFPATLSAATNGVLFSTTLDNDAQRQSGVRSTITGAGGGDINAAFYGESTATGGNGYGVVGQVSGAATQNIGVMGYTAGGTNNIGVMGAIGNPALVSGTSAGGYFTNGTAAQPIAVFLDSTTPVVTIADGGATTFTQQVGVGGAPEANMEIFATAATVNVKAKSNDNTGSAVFTATDATGSINAEMTSWPLGASGTMFGVNKAYMASFNASGGNTEGMLIGTQVVKPVRFGVGDETRGIIATVKNLSDNVLTAIAVQTLGNDTGGGGSIQYCVYAADATTAATECGTVDFAGVDVTAGAGGEVCPTPTKVGTPLQALSGATLAVTFAAATGTDLCTIQVTANPNIATPTALWIKWNASNSGRVLTPQ